MHQHLDQLYMAKSGHVFLVLLEGMIHECKYTENSNHRSPDWLRLPNMFPLCLKYIFNMLWKRGFLVLFIFYLPCDIYGIFAVLTELLEDISLLHPVLLIEKNLKNKFLFSTPLHCFLLSWGRICNRKYQLFSCWEQPFKEFSPSSENWNFKNLFIWGIHLVWPKQESWERKPYTIQTRILLKSHTMLGNY